MAIHKLFEARAAFGKLISLFEASETNMDRPTLPKFYNNCHVHTFLKHLHYTCHGDALFSVLGGPLAMPPGSAFDGQYPAQSLSAETDVPSEKRRDNKASGADRQIESPKRKKWLDHKENIDWFMRHELRLNDGYSFDEHLVKRRPEANSGAESYDLLVKFILDGHRARHLRGPSLASLQFFETSGFFRADISLLRNWADSIVAVGETLHADKALLNSKIDASADNFDLFAQLVELCR